MRLQFCITELIHKEIDKSWREVHLDQSTVSGPNLVGSIQPTQPKQSSAQHVHTAVEVTSTSGLLGSIKEPHSQVQYSGLIENQMQLHTNNFSCELDMMHTPSSSEPSSFVDLDEINLKRDRLGREKVSEKSNLLAPCRNRSSSAITHTTTTSTTAAATMTTVTNTATSRKSPENVVLSSLPVVVAKRSMDNQSNRPSLTDRGRQYDPRPYKCSVCNVGFRVMGHLHKHYRAKSHLIMVLQSEHLPVDSVDYVRQSRVCTSQIVNPENGQLRPRATERIIAMLRQVQTSASTPTTNSPSEQSSQHNSVVSPESR